MKGTEDRHISDAAGYPSDTSANNRRIAKNTLLLYVRMIVLMLVSLYTSRVVLDTLGVEDYGIYNVVGGIVVMFSFLNSAMASATQRYLTFELGRSNMEQLKNVFVTSVNIHIIIAVAVFILSETLGLWFLYNKMTIPADRMNAAFWVFQFSVISSMIMFVSVPYNAAIIAHEKMSAFAYISVWEAILKLLIVYVLLVAGIDKLILYAMLLLCVQLLVRIIYGTYCKRHFDEAKYRLSFNKQLFKEMLAFSGWNLFGNMSAVAFTQGLNILLNMFFGPVVNAARGVAVQLQGAVSQFSCSFQTALNPQITKSYALKDYKYMHSLIYRSSRFTFILLYCICLPVFMEAEMLLGVWLKEVPDYSAVFLRIILCVTIIDAVANPLMISAQATGKIKKYQSVVGGILLMILPVSYVVLKLGGNPQSVFIVHLVICIIAFITRLYIIRPMISLDISEYFRNVILRCLIVAVLSPVVPMVASRFLRNGTVISSLAVCFCAVISVLAFSFIFGITSVERTVVIDRVKNVVTNNMIKKWKER